MFRKIFLIFASFLVSIAACASSSASLKDPFTVRWDKGSVDAADGSDFSRAILIGIPDGYYLYADKLDVEFVSLEGLRIKNIRYPEKVVKRDPVDNSEVRAFEGDSAVDVSGEIPRGLSAGRKELVARVYYQGCSEKQCYPPAQKEIALVFNVTGETSSDSSENKPAAYPSSPGGEKTSLWDLVPAADFSELLTRGVLWTALIVFFAGVLASLTPCMWPIVPAVLVVIGIEKQKGVVRNVLLALSLASGLVLVHAILGIAATALGRNLGFVFQQRWFLMLVVVFFVAMSLSLLGVFEIHFSRLWEHRLHRLSGKGFRGAFLSGAGLGLIATPCTGPVVAALLGYVALQSSYVQGFLLLVIYGLGLSFLIVILGATYGILANRLRSGPWLIWIKRTLGVILLIPAAFYLGSFLKFDGAIPVAGKPAVEWVDNFEEGLAFADKSKRPVMVDFYADWCAPCRSLDRRFFVRDDIVRLSYRLVPIRVDISRETSEIRSLMARYKVMGVPTFLFLKPGGEEFKDLRVESPDQRSIEEAMKSAVSRTRGNE